MNNADKARLCELEQEFTQLFSELRECTDPQRQKELMDRMHDIDFEQLDIQYRSAEEDH